MAFPTRSSLPVAFFAAGAACLLSAVRPLPAQIVNGNQWPVPRLSVLTPFGAKPGATLEVTFGGLETADPEALLFSHPGIKGVPIVPEPPKVDPKKPDMKKDPPPVTKFTVTVDKSVPPGFYDVRLVTAKGVSNPRRFVVADEADEMEKEPNNDVEQAQKLTFGTAVYGSIAAATDVDYYQFAAKKGQRVLFHLSGASVDSRINPEMRVFDGMSRQLAYARPLPGADGLLDFTAPADGDFLLRLNQFTYTVGGADYFYRLTAGSLPWIDAIHPPVVEPGKPAQVTIYGRNLPGGKADPSATQHGVVLEKLVTTINAPADRTKLDFLGVVTPWQGLLDGFQHRIGASNPKFVALAQAPVVLENDDNDTAEKAQNVPVPCEIAGRIDKRRDRDWFAFDAKKGDVYVIEGFSHRLGAPTDLYFKLVNAGKKTDIVTQDDNPDNVSPRGYFTPTRDPAPYRFVAPEDGKYQLLVGSHLGDIAAGPIHQYQIRIAKETPDFRLIAMPAEDYRPDAFNVGRGGAHHFNVYAVRRNGFKGDIELSVEGLPAGVTAPPQRIAGPSKSAYLVVLAGDNAPEKHTGPVKIVGTSVIDGKKVVREARPASVTWAGSQNPQQNAPGITRHDHALMLAIRAKAPVKMTAEKDNVVVLVGEKAEIPMKLVRHDPEFKGNFQITPVTGDLPTGVTFGNLTFAPGKDEQKLALTTAANTPPGQYSVTFRGFGPIAPPQAKGKPVNTIVPSTPVTLTIVPKQVATVAVDNGNPPLVVGKEAALGLKVTRQFDYAGEFKVQVLPENANGVVADPITIGPGQSDGKLTLKIPANGPPGQRSNLTVRAVAVVHGLTLNHDLKFNVNVMPEPKTPDPKKK